MIYWEDWYMSLAFDQTTSSSLFDAQSNMLQAYLYGIHHLLFFASAMSAFVSLISFRTSSISLISEWWVCVEWLTHKNSAPYVLLWPPHMKYVWHHSLLYGIPHGNLNLNLPYVDISQVSPPHPRTSSIGSFGDSRHVLHISIYFIPSFFSHLGHASSRQRLISARKSWWKRAISDLAKIRRPSSTKILERPYYHLLLNNYCPSLKFTNVNKFYILRWSVDW